MERNILEWKVHVPNLLKEILMNSQTAPLAIPLCIFGRLLYAVGECARRINDPELNKLMIRLTIYSQADPESQDYDPKLCEKILRG